MNRRAYIALLGLMITLLCPCLLRAQSAGTVTVSGSHVVDASGTVLPSGTMKFSPTDNNGNPIGFRTANGQAVQTAPQATVTNGVFSQVLADAFTSGGVALVCYNVTLTDNGSGNVVQSWPCVQPSAVVTSSWCTGSTCNFDNYPTTVVPYTIGSTLTGAISASSLSVAGNGTIAGTLGVGGQMTVGGGFGVSGLTTLQSLSAGSTQLTSLLVANPGSATNIIIHTADDGIGNTQQITLGTQTVASTQFQVLDGKSTGSSASLPLLLGLDNLSTCLGENPGTGKFVFMCADSNGDMYPIGNATLGDNGSHGGAPWTQAYINVVNLGADPTGSLQAATKHYVDQAVASSGGGSGGGGAVLPTGVNAQVYATPTTPSVITCTGISQSAGTAVATGCTYSVTSVSAGLLVTTTTALSSPYTAYNVSGATISATSPSTSGTGTISFPVSGSPGAYSGAVSFSTTLAAALTNSVALQNINSTAYASQSVTGTTQNGIANAAAAYAAVCNLIVGQTTPVGCVTGAVIDVDPSYGGYGLGSGTAGANSEDISTAFPSCSQGTGFCPASVGNYNSGGQNMGTLTQLPFNTTIHDQRGGTDTWIYHDPYARYYNDGSNPILSRSNGSGDSGQAAADFVDYVTPRGNSQLIPYKHYMTQFAGGQNGGQGFGNKTNTSLSYTSLTYYSKGQHAVGEIDTDCLGEGDCMGMIVHHTSSFGLARGGDEGHHRGDNTFGSDPIEYNGYVGSGTILAGTAAATPASSVTLSTVAQYASAGNQGEGRYFIDLTQAAGGTLSVVSPLYVGSNNTGTCTQESSTSTTGILTNCGSVSNAGTGAAITITGLSGYNVTAVPVLGHYPSVTGSCTAASVTSNIATATGCSNTANLAAGSSITFAGFTNSAYNITALITSVSSGVISYTLVGSPASTTGTGSFTTAATIVYALSGSPAAGTTTLSWSVTSFQNVIGNMMVTSWINYNSNYNAPGQVVSNGFAPGASTFLGVAQSAVGAATSGTATAASLSGTTATITVPTTGGLSLSTGAQITVAGFVSPYTAYNGTWTLVGATATTISFTITGSPGSVSGASATWTQVAGWGPYLEMVNVSTGAASTCAGATDTSNVATLTGCSGDMAVMPIGTSITVANYGTTTPSYNGTFTVTANSGTTLSYALVGSPGSASASTSGNVIISGDQCVGASGYFAGNCSGSSIANQQICFTDNNSIDYGFVVGGPYTITNNVATIKVANLQRTHGKNTMIAQAGTCGWFMSMNTDAIQIYDADGPVRFVLPLAGSPSSTDSYYWFTSGGSYAAPEGAGLAPSADGASSGWTYYSKTAVTATATTTALATTTSANLNFNSHEISPTQAASYGDLAGQTLVITAASDSALIGSYTITQGSATAGTIQITDYNAMQISPTSALASMGESITGIAFYVCNCTATLYPGTEVTGVLNTATNKVDGTITTSATGITINNGDQIEIPQWHQPFIGTAAHNKLSIAVPLNDGAGFSGEGTLWTGKVAGSLLAVYELNDANACNYLGGGGQKGGTCPTETGNGTNNAATNVGTMLAPTAPFASGGVWNNLFIGFTAPESTVINVTGCKATVGCNAYDSDYAFSYLQGASAGASRMRWYPQTNTLMFQAGNYNGGGYQNRLFIGSDVSDLHQNQSGDAGVAGMGFLGNFFSTGFWLGAQSGWAAATPVTGILGTGLNLLTDNGGTIGSGKSLTFGSGSTITCSGCTATGFGSGSGTVATGTPGQLAVYTAGTTVGSTATPSVTSVTLSTGIGGVTGSTFTPGAAAGTGATSSCYQGQCDEISGTVTLATGTSTTTAGTALTVVFPNTRTHIPACEVQVSLSGGAGLYTTFSMTESTTGFVLGSGTSAMAASSTYRIRYICGGS
jgi:hypothetical protein